MLGSFSVGKTSLVHRFVDGSFSERYLSTVGVQISKKTVSYTGQETTLMLWDINGEDEFQKVQPTYLRGSSGCFLVVDGTRRFTLDVTLKLKAMAEKAAGPIPFVVLMNKADLIDRWEATAAELASAFPGLPAIHTSAKTGEGVEESFKILVENMVQQDKNA